MNLDEALAEQLNVYSFKCISEAIEDKYVKRLKEIYTEDGYGITTHLDPQLLGAVNGHAFSITGGYCRNMMLNTVCDTDIDVVCDSSNALTRSLSKHFEATGDNARVKTFNFLDNTLHIIEHPYRYSIDDAIHVFIDPASFDFTINLGCISLEDCKLYAPPITIYDIKNKIVRSTLQPMYDKVSFSTAAELSVVLRAMRFALKYGMSIHSSLIKGMNVLFALQNFTKQVDDLTLYHGLRHLYHDSDELRKEFYTKLKALNFIDTDKYPTFDDYFKYISEKANHEPRMAPFAITSPHSEY